MSSAQKEEMISAAELLKAKAAHYLSTVEATGADIGLDQAINVFDTLNMERHDLYGRQWCLGNRKEYTGTDVDPVQKVMDFLKEGGDKPASDEILERSRSPKFRGFKKTPDHVEIEYRDNELFIRIIDFAVSRSPKYTIDKKVGKYRPYIDLFNDDNVSLVITVLNPLTLEETVEVEGAPWDELLPREGDAEVDTIYADTEKAKEKIQRALSADDKEAFEDWLSHKNKYGEGIFIRDVRFDHAMHVEDFIKLASESSGWKEFIEPLDEKQRSFLEAMLTEGEPLEYRSVLSEFLGAGGNVGAAELEDIMTEWEKHFMQLAEMYKAKHIPREPTETELLKSIESLEKKASETFAALGRSKILSPIPVDFSTNIKRAKRSDLKHSRILNLRNSLKNVTKKDDLINGLLLLTEFAECSDEQLKQFKEGEICFLSDGTIMPKAEFETRIRKEQIDRSKLAKDNSLSIEEKDDIVRSIEKGKLLGISMKKGDVIVVKPRQSKEVVRLFEMAGVGAKLKREADPVKETKVESLPFWDDEGINFTLRILPQ